MVFDDLCLKIYFWPFLTYLASLKGLCPFYPQVYFPITTSTPATETTPTTPIPSIQPTPPTTLPPCPADPLVCLAGGERPISYCPCIDPRQQNGQTTINSMITETSEHNMNSQNLQLRSAGTAVMGSDMMIFSRLENKKRRKRRKKRGLKKQETDE